MMKRKATPFLRPAGTALLACLLLCLSPIPFPRRAAAAEDYIAVAATDYSTGKLHTLDPDDPWERHCDVAGICNDAVLRWHGGLVYVINRFGCDNIQVLDPEQGFATVLEFSVGAGSNPQGIAFSPDGDKAYVTRQNSASILIVDPANGDWLGSIDVSAWADADGSPEQGDCVTAGDYVFAALLRLDRDFYWLPVGDSYLAVIDPASDMLVDLAPGEPGVQALLLQATNPVWELKRGMDGAIYLACAGVFGLLDGGIERVDPVALTSELIVSEGALGGDVGDVHSISAERAYALISDAQFNTLLMSFDPGSGGDVQTVASGDGYVFTDMELDSTGELYLTDRSLGASGLRIFDAASGILLSTPQGGCLPPFDILVPGEGGTSVDPPPAAPAASFVAWPNPFNPRTTLSWSGFAAGGATLSIFDIAGRKRAEPFAGTQSGSGQVVWDGRGTDGRRLASGVYLARFAAAGRELGRRLILIQ